MTEHNKSAANGESISKLDAELERELAEALGDQNVEEMMEKASAPNPDLELDRPEGKASKKGGSDEQFEIEIKRGRVSSVEGDDVFIELSGMEGKLQGIVPLTQFDRAPRVGSIMDFVVQNIDEDQGIVSLSREGAVSRATWETLRKGSVTEARVVATNKGGLELEMAGGIRAFMPASQVDIHHTDDLTQFVGQKVHGVVQELDRKSKKVVVSRRQYLERERETKKEELWKTLEVGQTKTGKVASVMDYGAFVDIGGVDGLIHVSDLSYKHITKPSEVVKVGQEVTVKILKLDPEKNRVSLGLKQVAPDPWTGIAGRLKVGEQVTGRVVRTADFGAFVQIEDGIEALLPASEISWKRNVRPADMFKEGDVLRLAVLSVDEEKRRISLSLKQAQGDPWVGAEHKYAANTIVKAKVISVADFGAFLEVEAGLEGLVHISELSDKRVESVEDILKVGQEAEFRVLDVDETNRRIRLSLKAVANPPAEQMPSTTTSSHSGSAQPKAGGKAGAAHKRAPAKGGGGLGKNGALGMGLGDLKF